MSALTLKLFMQLTAFTAFETENLVDAHKIYKSVHRVTIIAHQTSLSSERNNDWSEKLQQREISFLSVSKAVKVVSCITDFRVSTDIIAIFVSSAS